MLTIDSITVGYGRTTVLRDVSVEVPTSGGVAVMGHNGAGKTTLLRAVVGLLTPTKGTITFNGVDITRMRPNRRVRLGMAYVPQGQQSFPHLSAMENLQLVADGRKRGPELVAEALDTFPALTPLLTRQAGLLSGGQRQQLAIARALICEPTLLILDEPTEGIQPSVVSEIEEKIRAITERSGMSVLLVEQHVGFALDASDHFYILAAGRVADEGDGGAGAEAHVRKSMAI